jgi:hypothetical protein
VKSESIITLSLLLGLLALPAAGHAGTAGGATPAAAPIHLAEASADNEEDEEDEEEEAVDYRDRVREIQRWMNRRDSERKGDAPSLNAAPAAPPPAPFPRYFRDKGYDENGYRKPDRDKDVQVRLRNAPEESAAADYTPRRHYYRHHAWHKRWKRHVHPRIRYHGHYSRHYGHAHEGWGGGGSRHHPHHRAPLHYGQSHAQHPARAHGGHAKAAPTHYAAKARPAAKPARHYSKPVATPKSAKKGRSHR